MSALSPDRQKALDFTYPDAIPVSVNILPSAWIKHRAALAEIVRRHPVLFGSSDADRDYDHVANPTYVVGAHVDVWGCVWSNIHHGQEAIVTHHPVPTRTAVNRLLPPRRDGGLPHGFMYLRLSDLRGFEELMLDFAEEPPELQRLIDIVLAYNQRQLALELARRKEPGIYWFGDDLGMQHALPISPAKWRQYLKPCYAALFGQWRAAGHLVYFHTDGHILPIVPDLLDCGVHILNPQIRANGLAGLVAACKGKVCVDLDLDRQLFPFCAPADIDRHVQEAVAALGSPAGGLWLKAEVDDGVPLANVAAICTALERHRHHFA